MNRRDFSKTLALGLGSSAVLAAATPRNLKIGHTCITWGTFPTGWEASATLDPAMRDISSLGYNGFETFPENLEDWDKKGQLQGLIDKYKLPLTSGYLRIEVLDPAKAKSSLEGVIKYGKLVKQYGGRFGVIQVSSVKRNGYDFKMYRDAIVAGLNDSAKALNDIGLGAGLHPHTGTAIETRDEVYYTMETCDTRHMKFAPDVGQLQKGGADAAKTVKDFVSITRHMHLKDYKGWEYYAGYCPLGMGQVDVTAILNTLEEAHQQVNVMVELDQSRNGPMTPLETATISKTYLEKLGYQFRTKA
jgi:inosose dehydratase